MNDQPKSDADAVEKSLYFRLFQRGYKFEYETQLITAEGDERQGLEVPKHPTMKRVAADPLVIEAYDYMLRMRGALLYCKDMFEFYARQHEAKRGGMATMVEQQQLEEKIERNRAIAKDLAVLIEPASGLPSSDWRAIATAPLDTSPVNPIRLFGPRFEGGTYIETGWRIEDHWSVEERRMLPPTHWMPMEKAPDGF